MTRSAALRPTASFHAAFAAARVQSLALLVLALAALWAGQLHAAEKNAADLIPTRVVAPRDTGERVSADGYVEAVTQAVVSAQVAGRVLSWHADAGDRVGAGQPLLTLDAREAAEGVAAARARMVQADAALVRVRDLQQKQFVSAAAVDQAIAEADAAKAALQSAEATLSHARVVAPFSGIVASRQVDVGDLASPGRPLVTVFQPGALRAIVQLPAAQAAAVRANQGALAATVEVNGQGKPIPVTRVQVLPTADTSAHVVTLRLDLPDAASRQIVPGSAVRASFRIGESSRLTLPADAVVHRGGIAGVYIKDAEGRFRLRQVRLGEAAGDGEVEILSGLLEGETVALDPVKAVIFRRNQSN
jgi:RND family efflux transporter MFP subunit